VSHELLTIPKRCLRHGITWDGPSFTPLTEDERTVGYRVWPCERCVDAFDARMANLALHPAMPSTPRARPGARDLQLPAEVDTPPPPAQQLLLGKPLQREPGED